MAGMYWVRHTVQRKLSVWGTPAWRPDPAVAALEQLSEVTRAAATDWALGIQARCRALLSEGEAAEQVAILDHQIIGVVFHPGYEEHLLLAQIGEPLIIDVAVVDGQQCPRFIVQLPGYSNLMLLAFGDHRVTR